MNKQDLEEIRKSLVDSNGELAQVLVELQFAEDEDLLLENLDEIDDMLSDAKQGIEVVQREIDRVQEENSSEPINEWNTDAQFVKALEER